jgi:ketosteroid isomerase-like protein
MTAQRNRDLVVAALNGENNEFIDLMADDVVWTVPGTTKFSGVYKGKPELLGKLLGPAFAQIASMGRTIIDNVIATDDWVVVQAHAEDRTTVTGQPYNNTYCWVMRVVDGRVTEMTEYGDTELVTDAFGR